MSCGHRGIPCRTEEKRVSRLLRKSGFIPMLEEVHDKIIPPRTPNLKGDSYLLAKKLI
jgi:hypothetical protein